jgi:hypothetical protein
MYAFAALWLTLTNKELLLLPMLTALLAESLMLVLLAAL